MTIGTVKFFNPDKGFGFIAPEGGGNDAFVHISAVERAGMRTLDKDQRVSYDLEKGSARQGFGGEPGHCLNNCVGAAGFGPVAPMPSDCERFLGLRSHNGDFAHSERSQTWPPTPRCAHS